MSQCEFCDRPPIYKFVKDDYVRCCCYEHVFRLARLIYLDLGIRVYLPTAAPEPYLLGYQEEP